MYKVNDFLIFIWSHLDFQQFAPLRGDEEDHAIDSSVQRWSSTQQDEEHYVGEQCGEVGYFAGTSHPLYHHEEQHDPGEQQAQCQPPLWSLQAIVKSKRIFLKNLPSGIVNKRVEISELAAGIRYPLIMYIDTFPLDDEEKKKNYRKEILHTGLHEIFFWRWSSVGYFI